MTTEQRIRVCLLAEKMNAQKSFSEKLGLEDLSKLHGKRITMEEENEIC